MHGNNMTIAAIIKADLGTKITKKDLQMEN